MRDVLMEFQSITEAPFVPTDFRTGIHQWSMTNPLDLLSKGAQITRTHSRLVRLGLHPEWNPIMPVREAMIPT
jgi:hypothetical protein